MTTWVVLRAAGIGAYLMLFASVAWGLVGTTGVIGKHVAKATAIAIHQFLSFAVLPLVAIHLVGLLLDKFQPFRVPDLFVPLRSVFKPTPVAFGILALYTTIVVLGTSWSKRRLGPAWWRRFHLLSVPAFIMAMVHGIFTGTDTVRPWVWWMYLVTGLIVLYLLIVRALTADVRPERHERPPQARPARPARPEPGVPAPVGASREGAGEDEAVGGVEA